jgi:hypothetical protein
VAEFNDIDLTDDQHDDSDLVRQLRKQLRDKDRELKAALGEVEAFRTQTVESAIKDALKGVPEDRRAKVEKLIRKEAKTTEDVQTWLDEYSDVFDIRQGVDVSGAETAGNAAESGEESAGVDPSTRAAFEAAQRTEAGAGAPVHAGPERIKRLLAETSGGYDAVMQKLREEGLAQ